MGRRATSPLHGTAGSSHACSVLRNDKSFRIAPASHQRNPRGVFSHASCKVIPRDIYAFPWRLILKQGNHGNSHSGKPQDHGGHAGDGMERHLHNPIADKLIPLEPLDLGKVKSIDDLVRAMSKTAFTGRQLGEAADVLEAMARDEECFVVMTLSGAMTVAKQGLIVT